MGALILSLQQLGWNPRMPDEWGDASGETWRFQSGGVLDFRDIMKPIARDMQAQLWTKAADHYY
eukprot:3786173-Pyramimonas_sp.AAC.1